MKPQNFEVKDASIREAFLKLKKEQPEKVKKRLNLSWSNWGFGLEKLSDSCARLAKAGIHYIELHGNHYGADIGYKPAETKKILSDYGIRTGGVCGMFSADNDLSSNRAIHRQAAIEPIRAAETSLVHTFEDAKQYIAEVNSPGVQHINGDVYHMLVGESHIGQAILDAGGMLTNLHMADTNRCALGDGFLDLDTIIMALYLIGYNNDRCFVTPEPLGPGGDPYPAMNGRPDASKLDKLVMDTANYFREREEAVLFEDI
jgi:sugar phosphate isomerase/epimerase